MGKSRTEKGIIDLAIFAVVDMLEIGKTELSTDEFEYMGKTYEVRLTVKEIADGTLPIQEQDTEG